jgi:hypothetical protein
MLYPDSEKRIEEINKIANLFAHKGYPLTEKEVQAFAEMLKGDKIPSDFLYRLDALLNIHQKEFEAILPVGQNYRKRCFEEIGSLIIKAFGRMRTDYAAALLTIYPLFQRLGAASKITGSIAEELAQKRIQDKSVIFHLRCYSYLILVEGIFDELGRILYFLATVDKNSVPKIQELEKMNVWQILAALKNVQKSTPVFLERWEEKNHIRNSIGHARADYNPSKDEVRFVDVNKKGKLTYDSNYIPFAIFAEKALELEDSLTAFLHIFLLLRIYDFIVAPSPFV